MAAAKMRPPISPKATSIFLRPSCFRRMATSPRRMRGGFSIHWFSISTTPSPAPPNSRCRNRSEKRGTRSESLRFSRFSLLCSKPPPKSAAEYVLSAAAILRRRFLRAQRIAGLSRDFHQLRPHAGIGNLQHQFAAHCGDEFLESPRGDDERALPAYDAVHVVLIELAGIGTPISGAVIA